MKIDYEKLLKFLYDANKNGYAGAGKEIKPQRSQFKEIEYKNDDWYYRDSYSGFFFAPGQEVVYFKNKPIWAMAYAGGMKFKYHGNTNFALKTFRFLKKALLKMDQDKPFRGPKLYKSGDWKYISNLKGDAKDFNGSEKIYYKNELVFAQNFIGGIIVAKEF